MSAHRPVLLIGSLPYKSVDEVFDITGPALAGYASSLPDGEAQGWVNFPGAKLAQTEGLEPSDRLVRLQPDFPAFPLLRIKSGVDPSKLEFPRVGYDDIALRSYEIFKRKRAEGKIAPGTRFQVSLPTAFGVVGLYVLPEQVQSLLPRFEESYLRDVDAITRAIPAQDLAFQWDIAVEIISALLNHVEGLAEHAPMEFLAEATARIADRVPSDVPLGLHFCYGNPGGHHIIQPTDTGLMVRFADAILQRTQRPIAYVHMPVPVDRNDHAYFAPLRDLTLRGGTQLFLGLVHLADGLDGSRRRLEAAKKFSPDPHFGVGWECGMRYFTPESVPEMLELYKQVADLN